MASMVRLPDGTGPAQRMRLQGSYAILGSVFPLFALRTPLTSNRLGTDCYDWPAKARPL